MRQTGSILWELLEAWYKTCQNYFTHEVTLPYLPEAPASDITPTIGTPPEWDEMAVVQIIFGKIVNEIQQLFRDMIANSSVSAATALRHALLALCFQYLTITPDAIFHQNRSIESLQSAMEKTLPWHREEAFQMVAASMLLSLYEMEIGESSLRWAIFFSGTKRIMDTIYNPGDTYEGNSAVIMDWIFYCSTMYKFSVLHWLRTDELQTWLERQKKILSKPLHSPRRQVILPSWGCSLELLDILHDIFNDVHDRNTEQYMSPEHTARLDTLEWRLRSLSQREEHDAPSTNVPSYNSRAAEFYRLNALLYLERVARGSPRDAQKVIELVTEAYTLLEYMETFDRPWPLFVLALEASTEDERRTVLAVIETVLERLPLRKWVILRKMVQQAWGQSDLAKFRSLDALVLYRSVMNVHRVPPSFI
ncbi:fungal-specific transcription factor domain-containing protein [Trichoderma velutinum]